MIDASTGDFLYTELLDDQLKNEIMRLQPTEIVVENAETEALIKDLKLDYKPAVTIFESWYFEPQEAAKALKSHFGVATLEAYGPASCFLGKTAAGIALAYIQSLKKENLKQYQFPSLLHIR